ncbi:hypothetical protein BDW62DRAFT_201371 [Aspergillus aurantiobrunneus]
MQLLSSPGARYSGPLHLYLKTPEGGGKAATEHALGRVSSAMYAVVTRWGFQHHFLLHLFLALFGFHLARDPNGVSHLLQVTGQDIDYAAEAEKHYDIAVREAASAVPHITGCNGQIMYTTAVLIFICSLARGPQPGVRSVLELCSDVLSLDVVNIHIQSESVQDDGETQDPTEPDHLEHLRLLLNSTYSPNQSTTHLDYSRVLDKLKQTYALVHPPPDSPLAKMGLFPHIFGWLYTLPDNFLSSLQQQQPLPLTFFAFFTILMKAIDSAWFIRGWPEHIMDKIWTSLDTYHRQFAMWPMRELAPGMELAG